MSHVRFPEPAVSDSTPEKRSFYKYATPDTALAVLKNRTVRYSSPLKFNDPFDFQSGLHFDFDLDSLHGKVFDRLHELATNLEEPPVDKNDPWGKIVLLIRENYLKYGLPDHLRTKSSELFSKLVAEMSVTQQQYQEHWRKLLPGIRVFCVSEDRDNLLMWAHYAKDHTGAVFEFLSLPEEDNPLSIAKPVTYVDRPPPLFSEAEWINDILSLQRLNTDDLYKRYAYIKSTHWRYEKEWRVWYPQTPAPEGLWFDCPIRQSEFAAVYIGCRAKPDFTDEVRTLTYAAFPHARIFKARKENRDYALKYEEI